jgi:hypothetical protein
MNTHSPRLAKARSRTRIIVIMTAISHLESLLTVLSHKVSVFPRHHSPAANANAVGVAQLLTDQSWRQVTSRHLTLGTVRTQPDRPERDRKEANIILCKAQPMLWNTVSKARLTLNRWFKRGSLTHPQTHKQSLVKVLLEPTLPFRGLRGIS